ncbi:MAG: hypothetical protein ACREA9_15045 [Pyrinomonadaceae bacterium]
MREYTVEQSSLNFKWSLKRMIPSLPGPGTPAFATLCKGLQPFGLIPSRVTVEAPTARLSDVALSIALLDNRVTLRITPADFEMFVNQLVEGDENNLVEIANLSFAALFEMDDDARQGKAEIRVSSHLKLAPLENFAILHEHLRLAESIAGFIPEAAVYQVEVSESPETKELRVVVAKSIVFEDALFIDITAPYDGEIDIPKIARQVELYFELVTEKLGLTEKAQEGV